MAQDTRICTEDRESFREFFECWLTDQNNYLEELSKASNDTRATPPENLHYEQGVLVPLIQRVIEHYEHYYRNKSNWVHHDALVMLNPSWRSTLENAFVWIGGWRPSMAYHLLYSKTGLQLGDALAELYQEVDIGNLGDLSANQLSQVNVLQARTIRKEREITEKLAAHQETVTDTSMVDLSHIVTEQMRTNETDQTGAGVDYNRVMSILTPKEEALVDILRSADDLRLNTFKEVVNILTPSQTVHFLIAAAELHLRLHDWGKRRDAIRNGGYVIQGNQ